MPVPHRPARTSVPLPGARSLELVAPPAPAAAGSGWLMGVLPALGILPVVVLGAGGHARGAVVLVAALAVPALFGTVGVVVGQRRRQRREHRAVVARWRAHVSALADEAAAAAVQQRLALDRRHPADLAAMLPDHAFERRPDDDDALHVTVGCGAVPALVRLVLPPPAPLEPLEPELREIAMGAVDRAALVAGVPVGVDLASVRVLAVVGSRAGPCVTRIAAEIAVLHAPGEVGLDGAYDRDGEVTVRVVQGYVPGADRHLDAELDLAVVGCASAADVPAAAGAVLDTDARTLRLGGGPLQHLDTVEVLEPPAAQAISTVLVGLTPDAGARPALVDLLPGDHGDLGVPIGIDPLGAPVVLRLSEAAAGGDGPHGLLVGATGSGKSVLLRTIVAGLAARHPPARLHLLLVDFKGGAAFADLAASPHVAGLVTNLAEEPTLLARVAASLGAELERRQRVLREAGAASVREAPEALAALVIVVDEAGELLAAAPEVAEVLARIGRVGRSLGVHLLLSTQTWDGGRMRGLDAHLRYRLCLRTVGADDSRAVLGSDAATRLPRRSGAAWLAVDGALRRVDVAPPPDDPASLVPPSAETARPVWLPPLPTVLEWPEGGTPGVIGLVDRPDRQARPPLLVPGDTHVAVVGGPRSGVTTTLRAIVLASGAARVDVLDLTGGLSDLAVLPHVGTVAGLHEPDLVAAVVAAAADDLRTTDQQRLLVVDGLAALRSTDGTIEAALAEIAARGLGAGVRLVLGVRRWAELRGGLHEACATRLELRLGDPAESHAGRAAASRLDAVPGRGIGADGHPFQVALPPAPRPRPGRRVPPIRVLPTRVLEPVGHGDGAHLLGVGGPDVAPVTLDLLSPGRHLVVAGDAGSGRSTVLRRLVRHLAPAVAIHVVDVRRAHVTVAGRLTTWAHDPGAAAASLAAVAGELRGRLPPPDADPAEIACAAAVVAEPVVVVLDDLDLLDGPPALSASLAELAALLPYSAEIGLHVVVARPAAARSFDPLSQRLRTVGPTLLQLPGEHAEGPAAGRGAPRLTGRGVLSRPSGRPVLVQCFAEHPHPSS